VTRFVLLALLAAASACASGGAARAPSTQGTPARAADSVPQGPTGSGGLSTPLADPFPSTYAPFPARPTVIRNVTIFTAAGPRIENGAILLRDGKIAAVGSTVDAPADAIVIDGAGKFLTPGLIDTHSHRGVYAAPGVQANSDGNEATSPVTANVWGEHYLWPLDPQLPRALSGGITTSQLLR
jgi:hypothetical protein